MQLQKQQLNFSYFYQLCGHCRVQTTSATHCQRKWMRGRVNFHITCSVITERGLSKRTVLTLLLSLPLYTLFACTFTHSVISINVKELHLSVNVELKYETIIISSCRDLSLIVPCNLTWWDQKAFIVLSCNSSEKKKIQGWIAFRVICYLMSLRSSLTFLPEK